MLEKNEKKSYYDAHFHYACCTEHSCYQYEPNIFGCSCAHSIKEWENQKNQNENIILSYGLHPQSSVFYSKEDVIENIQFLEKLLKEDDLIFAIGETGFDYFTEEYKNVKDLQEEMWNLQLELAIQYQKPLILHCRKANEKLFEYSKELKKVPGVLFHSFMGPFVEAQSLLQKGINGFFSFGKQIMNNNKKVIDCVKNLPIENLLLETDAPFQTLKNEKVTKNTEIINIYEAAFNLRNETVNKIEIDSFMENLELNYYKLFNIISK